jgi:MYXO-CTERM domain-containing protein
MKRGMLLVVVVGCGGGGADPLEDADAIPQWANSSSAIGAFEPVREPVAFFDGAFDFPDPTCPMTTNDGTVATVVGGCTDSEGRTWTGSATVTLDGLAGYALTVELEDYGNDGFGAPLAASGVVTVEEVAPDVHAFEVDVTTRGGITTTIVYSGDASGTYTGPTIWNGEGTIRKSGDFFAAGSIDAETIEQVRDNDACAGEGFSGTTRMTSTEHVVVLTYDGETDCDTEHSAQWSLDGQDQGIIANITCSAGGAGGFGLVIVALCGVVVRRRRRS